MLAKSAARFRGPVAHLGANKIVTAEIGGIAPALTTTLALGIPVVYARKTKPVTMHQRHDGIGPLAHEGRHDRVDEGVAEFHRDRATTCW